MYNTPTHISAEAKDLLARMLNVVPDHRITFEQVGGFLHHFSPGFTDTHILHDILVDILTTHEIGKGVHIYVHS